MADRDQERQPLLNHQESFGVSVDELLKLVERTEPDMLEKLGGMDGLTRSLQVNPEMGLSVHADHTARRATFGTNTIPDPLSQSFWSLLVASYNDKTLIMLTVAAVVSLAIGMWQDCGPSHPEGEPRLGWVEGTAILVAVLTVILTNAINDYQKELQFKKLNAKKSDIQVRVCRDGREQTASMYDLMVGDMIELEPGDVVPADCVYYYGYNLTCDESSATGESDAVHKQPACENQDYIILSGSKILEGVGRALVISVGENSFHGRIMMAMRCNGVQSTLTETTPLQLKLDVLAEQIAKLGSAAAVMMLITLLFKYFITIYIHPGFPTQQEIASVIVNIVIQTITIIVVAVPEGLPMAVTMALAFATTQMLKDHNLVRVLVACETMGNATTICTDKTGTLTQNKMTVVKAILANESFQSPDQVKDWEQRVDQKVIDVLKEGAACNSTAYEDAAAKDGKVELLGSKTECALLLFIQHNLGGDYNAIREEADVKHMFPFSSQKKTMTTILKLHSPSASSASSDEQLVYRIHTKGAPEIILQSCTHMLGANGDPQPLGNTTRERLNNIIDSYASAALRIIAMAYRDIEQDEYSKIDDTGISLEKLVLIGVLAIEDPLRQGVVESVAAFRHAGVFVRMITGDNIKTAKAIAKSAGILTHGGEAMNASTFRNMSPEDQRKVLPRLQVLARSSPADKTTVVVRLQELGQVVAMTGDGTNDGPALKLADVGFSMGVTGTEVAKEASDIILMDDNFNSILKALLWGRTVNNGVRKFLTFQLTVNVVAVVVSFVSSVTSDNSQGVLSAVQLLWVNLIMDTLAALALATEAPSSDLLDQKPASKLSSLINFKMTKLILGEAVFQIAVSMIMIYAGNSIFRLNPEDAHDQAVLRTMVFNTFVFLQIFNEINCRRIGKTLNVFKNITMDWIFIAVQVAVVFCQVIIVTFGGMAFKTTPLSPLQWCITVLLGSLSLPVGLMIRLIPDCCGWELRYNEDATPLVSYSRLSWENAIGRVRTRLRLYSMLRKVYCPQDDQRLKCGYLNSQYQSCIHSHAHMSLPVSRTVSCGEETATACTLPISHMHRKRSRSTSARGIPKT